jgi:hypothetical protein
MSARLPLLPVKSRTLHAASHGNPSPAAGERRSRSTSPLPAIVPSSQVSSKSPHLLAIFTKVFSSSRINTFVAVIALGAGAYYFYGQYAISWKSWVVGVWKDCHDREVINHLLADTARSLTAVQDIVNTSVCLRYLDMSYDKIVGRSIEADSRIS